MRISTRPSTRSLARCNGSSGVSACLKLLRRLGYFCLHAAAVISPAGTGVLIVGPSGSGKSTLAVAPDPRRLALPVRRRRACCRRGDGLGSAAAHPVLGRRGSPLRVCRPASRSRGARRRWRPPARSCTSTTGIRTSRGRESMPTLLLFPTIVDAGQAARSSRSTRLRRSSVCWRRAALSFSIARVCPAT